MDWFKETLTFSTQGKGMYPVNDSVETVIRQWGIQEGVCFLFLPHASASLVISESYDPSARMDVEEFYERLVPEKQNWYQHTLEGPDDSPSHIRSTLTQNSISIPIGNERLSLGTWQGVFLFEHRMRPHQRRLLVRCLKIS
ncbi:MAG TPA: YjbQ family protein [Anaerolineae bacterium]|nr:YjbQ family protein [Anaerolineae bacterium]